MSENTFTKLVFVTGKWPGALTSVGRKVPPACGIWWKGPHSSQVAFPSPSCDGSRRALSGFCRPIKFLRDVEVELKTLVVTEQQQAMAEDGEARLSSSLIAGKLPKRRREGGERSDALYTSDVFRMYCYKVGWSQRQGLQSYALDGGPGAGCSGQPRFPWPLSTACMFPGCAHRVSCCLLAGAALHEVIQP